MENTERDESNPIPVVEKIDLSGILPSSDDPPRSSGYNSGHISTAKSSSRGRWVGSEESELQDIITLDSCLGTTIFSQRQHNTSLDESAKRLMNQRNYREASLLLEAIYPMTFRQQLLLAECYLYTGQRQHAKTSIGHAARLMTTSLKLRIQDLSVAIKKAIARKDFVKALILIHCSPRFAYLKMVPNDAVIYIERRVADYSHAVAAMTKRGGKLREYAKWFVTEEMLDILLLFREITKARFEKKIDCEARMLTYFGLCYRAIEHHTKSLECFQQGMEVLSLSFDDRVMNSKLYGILLHNAGLVCESLGDYVGAESHYINAYAALSFAGDFESYADKEKTLRVTESNLHLLRAKIDGALDADDADSQSTDELMKEIENLEAGAWSDAKIAASET